MNRKLGALPALLVLAVTVLLAVTGCKGSGSASPGEISSFTADPAASADIAQAKADVARCVTGTPLQQLATLRVLFLERESGSNGPAVKATRAKVFGCLGVPPAQQTAFKNAAITAAGHQTPKIFTAHPAPGVRKYLEITFPALLKQYQQAGSATPSSAVSGPAAVATASATPIPGPATTVTVSPGARASR